MLQKRIIRIITLSKYLAHTGPLFKELGLQKMERLTSIYLGNLCINGLIALLFQDMFQYVRNVDGYGTRQSDHLYTPIVKTNLGKCSLRYKRPPFAMHVGFFCNLPTQFQALLIKIYYRYYTVRLFV